MSDNELLLAISNIVEKQVESVKQELTQKIDKIITPGWAEMPGLLCLSFQVYSGFIAQYLR